MSSYHPDGQKILDITDAFELSTPKARSQLSGGLLLWFLAWDSGFERSISRACF
jgi:hypothetical protein